MKYYFLWDDEPGENVDHVAEHGLTPEDVESAFENILQDTISDSSGRDAIWGMTADGRIIFVAYDVIDEDDDLIYVHTAFEKETN